jgi:hypothetical protein
MATRVTATDVDTGESQTVEITDNYVLIREGRCRLVHTEVREDGTHVLTVRRPRTTETVHIRSGASQPLAAEKSCFSAVSETPGSTT